MDSIQNYRAEIDDIDLQIAQLLEKRFEVVKNIGNYKRERNLPVQDLDRDDIVISNAINSLKSNTYSEEVRKVFSNLIWVSKGMQY